MGASAPLPSSQPAPPPAAASQGDQQEARGAFHRVTENVRALLGL